MRGKTAENTKGNGMVPEIDKYIHVLPLSALLRMGAGTYETWGSDGETWVGHGWDMGGTWANAYTAPCISRTCGSCLERRTAQWWIGE